MLAAPGHSRASSGSHGSSRMNSLPAPRPALRAWMRPADYPIAAVIVIAVILYVYRHIKRAWWDGGPETAANRPEP